MSLHFGTLYWPGTHTKPVAYSALKDNIAKRVVIVGGGMSGVACGYALAKAGIESALIEQGRIAGGSSLANAGLLQYMNDKTLSEFIRTHGESNAVALYRACCQASERFHAIAEQLPRDVQFQKRRSLYFASSPEDVASLREECEVLDRHGFSAEWWDKDKIAAHFPFRKGGAILTNGDAEINPYLFVHVLAEEACKHGLSVYEHTSLRTVERANSSAGSRFIVRTSGGTIAADHVVYAVGYSPEQAGGRWVQAIPRRTYAIVTNELPSLSAWHERCMLWETARPYLYARTTPDNRIVVGGLDENVRQPVLSAQELRVHSLRLLTELKLLFPMWEPEIRYEWCAAFCESADGLPWIGEDPERPGHHYLLGYGGNGTIYSMLGADTIKDNLLGVDNPISAIIRPDRPVAVNAEELRLP